jgi:quercetin dioxygenase-like cupin family protein
MRSASVTLMMLSLLLSGCSHSRVGEFDFPDGVVQHAVSSAEIAWRQCPPSLPSGCEIAVLEGDPQAPGLFTVRFRLTDDFVMPPHTHPRDERVTVLAGRMAVGFGIDATRAGAREFGPGDYYVNARGAVHKVWAEKSSEIQITGLGPWEAHFVE